MKGLIWVSGSREGDLGLAEGFGQWGKWWGLMEWVQIMDV